MVETPHRRRKDHETNAFGSSVSQVGTITEPTPDDIARRAFELYERRGRTDGYDWEDWFQAERELKERHAPESSVESLIRTGAAVAV